MCKQVHGMHAFTFLSVITLISVASRFEFSQDEETMSCTQWRELGPTYLHGVATHLLSFVLNKNYGKS